MHYFFTENCPYLKFHRPSLGRSLHNPIEKLHSSGSQDRNVARAPQKSHNLIESSRNYGLFNIRTG